MRLRQIALVGQDLDAATADIVGVLGLGQAFADPGVGKFGLKNGVWPVGETFLEVVCPETEGTTAGRLLEKRGGDGGYMVILQVKDIQAARALIAAAGARVVEQADRKDGVAMSHVHPKDIGGAILSVDWMDDWDRWEWAGPRWRENVDIGTSTGIVGAELQAAHPETMAKRWGQVLGLEAQPAGDHWRLGLDGGEIRFVQAHDGRGDGLGAFDVTVRDLDEVRAKAKARGCLDARGDVVLCGTRVRLVQA